MSHTRVIVRLSEERGTDAFDDGMVFVSDANDLVLYHRNEAGTYYERTYAIGDWKAYSQGLNAPWVENKAQTT